MHDDLIARTGGSEGVLSLGALHSAIERAKWGPFEGEGDVPERAAFLLRGIALDHPFADGNKRTAFAAADVFLKRNGWRIAAEADEVVALMLAVARGERPVLRIAAWIRARLRNE